MSVLTGAPLLFSFLFFMCVNSSGEHQSGLKTVRGGFPDALGYPEVPWGARRDTDSRENKNHFYEKRHLLAGQGSSNMVRTKHGQKIQATTCKIKGILLQNNQIGKLKTDPVQLTFDLDSCRGKHRHVKHATLMLILHRNFNKSCNFLLRSGTSRATGPSASPPSTHPHFITMSNVRRERKSVCRVKYNIRKTVNRCLAHPRGTCILGLTLPHEVAGDGVGGEVVIDGSPVALRAASRVRRQVASEVCDAQEPHCCRRTMRVSFQDIGWSEWIFAPKEYNAYYCGGSCPPKHRITSAHTDIKTKMYQISRGTSPQTCCVPAAYRPLTVMNLNSKGQLTLSVLDNMIVSKCKCS